MITNERQYRVTRAQWKKFAAALSAMEQRTERQSPLAQLEQAALRSQHDELRQQLQDYEELRSGRKVTILVDSLASLPQALVKARIAAGLTQKQLAERLGLKEQQIQRYEATAFRSANLARLQAIVDALGVELHEELVLPARTRTGVK